MSLSAYVLPWPGTSILMRYDCVKDLSFIKCNPRRYFPWAATPPLRISFSNVFVIQWIHCCCLHVHGSLERGSKALCSSHLIWKVFFCKSTRSEVLRKSKHALCARSKQVKMSRTSRSLPGGVVSPHICNANYTQNKLVIWANHPGSEQWAALCLAVCDSQ